MKRRLNRIRSFAELVSDAVFYWRNGYRIRMAWHLDKQTIN